MNGVGLSEVSAVELLRTLPLAAALFDVEMPAHDEAWLSLRKPAGVSLVGLVHDGLLIPELPRTQP